MRNSCPPGTVWLATVLCYNVAWNWIINDTLKEVAREKTALYAWYMEHGGELLYPIHSSSRPCPYKCQPIKFWNISDKIITCILIFISQEGLDMYLCFFFFFFFAGLIHAKSMEMNKCLPLMTLGAYWNEYGTCGFAVVSGLSKLSISFHVLCFTQVDLHFGCVSVIM